MSENTHTPAPHSGDRRSRGTSLDPGNRQNRQASQWRHHRAVRRHYRAYHRVHGSDRERSRLSAVDRGLSRKHLFRGKNSWRLFQARRPPSEKEVLTSRLIDRPMRPLFPESWRNETQIVSMVLSADSDNDPDVIAVTSASAAAYCSDLPFDTPIAAVRVGSAERTTGRQPHRGANKKPACSTSSSPVPKRAS